MKRLQELDTTRQFNIKGVLPPIRGAQDTSQSMALDQDNNVQHE